MAQKRRKALIAMSGGVDSAVAALCMQEAGYDTAGITLRLFDGEKCGSLTATQEAKAVADRLGMPHTVLDCRKEFEREVIGDFITAYEQGDTPNPCIVCNRTMKFGILYEEMQRRGFDVLVTGHYARIEQSPAGEYCLKKAVNTAKDQTYVLYNLTQEQLAHTVFPLGVFESKEAVRQKAEEYGFANAHKHDSQDICFVENGKYAEFICAHTGKTYPEGDFVDASGKVLGRHKGIIGYTVGQRKGLGLSLPAPLYVCRKDRDNNRVILTPEADLFSAVLTADKVNWLSGKVPDSPLRLMARTRYSAKEAPATVTPMENNRVQVVFDTPQRAITTGQAVVFYDGDRVVAGGRIREK